MSSSPVLLPILLLLVGLAIGVVIGYIGAAIAGIAALLCRCVYVSAVQGR